MTWRGSSTVQERIFACLLYLIPLLEVMQFGVYLFAQIPFLKWFFAPVLLLSPIYFLNIGIGCFKIVPLVIFLSVFIWVVQDVRIRHFLRFNALQALLLAITVYLGSAMLELLGILQPILPLGFSVQVSPEPQVIMLVLLFHAIFLGTVAASFYAIFQSARGLYGEIPVISEAVYMQVR
jgi:uncharacterized membrane protein YwzB